MIYIFDDNKHGQLSLNYKFDYIEYFQKEKEYIRHFSSHTDYRSEEIFENADCVLIHYSFPDDIKTGYIKAKCKELSIPLVVFSNQYTGTVFANNDKNVISEIKKDRMYFNFVHFVDYYIEKKKSVLNY